MSASKLDNLKKKTVVKTAVFNSSNGVVVTVNPKLDALISLENMNAKAQSAKEMFANYRNKK